ncbi:MAG TPA: C40 family peptidase [Nitrospiria bacterium]|nr:C40 family peptidase [Nitrospiria bacterium]
MNRRWYWTFFTLVFLLSGCGGGKSLPSGGGVSAPQSQEKRVVAKAKSLLGVPYKYGGTTPAGFDCSGFVGYVFKKSAGVDLPRVSNKMYGVGKRISRTKLRPADLVYFKIEKQKSLHVGIYLGGGRFIHAPSSGKKVNIQDMNFTYWTKRYLGARRIL